jgi:hypothetical protein
MVARTRRSSSSYCVLSAGKRGNFTNDDTAKACCRRRGKLKETFGYSILTHRHCETRSVVHRLGTERTSSSFLHSPSGQKCYTKIGQLLTSDVPHTVRSREPSVTLQRQSPLSSTSEGPCRRLFHYCLIQPRLEMLNSPNGKPTAATAPP